MQEGIPTETQDLARWFMDDVVPLEPMLVRFLNRNWRNRDEIPDLLQEVYVRLYEAAAHEQPRAAPIRRGFPRVRLVLYRKMPHSLYTKAI